MTVESMPFESASSGDRWHSLKFWDVHSTGSGQTGYTVNSVVNDPHFGHITSLACHPHEVLVATTCASSNEGAVEGGLDGGAAGARQRGGFRLWRKRHFKRPPGAPPDAPTWHWRCASVNSYKGACVIFSLSVDISPAACSACSKVPSSYRLVEALNEPIPTHCDQPSTATYPQVEEF